MNRKISLAFAAAAAVAGLGLAQAAPASAAHCFEGDTPGFSYFGNDHVAQEDAHGGTPEGGNPGPHVVNGEPTSGASACPATANPSVRAPGQNKS